MKAGHDTTLRRFGASTRPHGSGVTIGALHPAYRAGNTMFPSRVFAPDEVARLLKDGHQQRKIGKEVRKGHRRGWPIFTLTLQERATCPRSCAVYGACFGNGMQAAERIEHGPALEAALLLELTELQAAHPRGFMVRLHVLGDFYSLAYVALWAAALERFPALHVFGFTARLPGTEIGDALGNIIENNWARFAVRFSGLEGPMLASRVVVGEDPDAIMCPAQTGAAQCCATCALCWHSQRSIGFRRH
jgi:hypothetical protein